MKVNEIHHCFLQCQSIAIDTRKIQSNAMFVAIKGNNFDANTFAKDALEKGAKFVIIDNKNFYLDDRTILVDDSLKCLQALANYHANYLNTPIIALTGSNGKTTTKELINAVLSQKFKTTATVGNLNNHIGVPLTLLSFTQQTEIGIVEMGANHQKEIEFLCQIAAPDYGYITNFGKAHLEGFGGVAGVIAGKSEMYKYLLTNNKKVFINLDDPIQIEKSAGIENISLGLNNAQATVNITKVSANPLVEIEFDQTKIASNLIGLYNANNINAAITIGKYFEVPDALIKKAIESYVPENNRSQLINKNGNQIILDAYNANPSSMLVAIDNFLALKAAHKLLILGDMFELGNDSNTEHAAIINKLLTKNCVSCYFIGNEFFTNKTESAHCKFFKNFDDLALHIHQSKPTNCTILIKGSRGMALERVLEII